MKKCTVVSLYVCLVLLSIYIIWRLVLCKPCKKSIGETIVIGTNAEYPPFSFIRNGEIVGFDIDVAKEVVQRLGKKIQVLDMPFDMLLPYTQLGIIHMIAAGISPKPTRARHVLFTKPYLENDPLLIITPATQKPIKSIDELVGKRVVVNDGYTADSYLSSRADSIVQRLATPAEAILLLQSGRADAYVTAQSSIQRFLAIHAKEYNAYAITGITDAYALVISPLYPELLPLVQQALDTMVCDGTLDVLKKRWGFA